MTRFASDQADNVEHRTVAQDGDWLVCTCGFRSWSVWGMSLHRKQAAGKDVGPPPVA
jgi:hypothetical protein